MKAHRLRLAALAAVAAMTGACQAGAPKQRAVLDAPDAAAIASLKATLAEAMGVARVDLGAGDPTESSALSVLPPQPGPYETNSPATPTIFDLIIEDGACFVVRRDTGEAFSLKDVACRPLTE